MAELVVQKVTLTGTKPNYVPVDLNGDFFINDGETFLHIKNTSTTLQSTVTIQAKSPCSHGSYHDIVVSIPAGEERQFGPLPTDRFNDLYRKVFFKCTMGTEVRVAVVKL
jgi:hypothetical protein